MATTSPEYHIPNSPESRQPLMEFESGDQLDFHKSKLDRLKANALGAATQTAATLEGESAPEVEKVEQLSPSEQVLQFGRQTMRLRDGELASNILSETSPRQPNYLDDNNRDAA